MTAAISAFVSDVIFDGYNYAIQFNYFAGIGDVIKSVCKNADRKWHAQYFRDPNKQYYRYWMVNKGVIDEIERRVITMDGGRIVRDDSKGKYVL